MVLMVAQGQDAPLHVPRLDSPRPAPAANLEAPLDREEAQMEGLAQVLGEAGHGMFPWRPPQVHVQTSATLHRQTRRRGGKLCPPEERLEIVLKNAAVARGGVRALRGLLRDNSKIRGLNLTWTRVQESGGGELGDVLTETEGLQSVYLSSLVMEDTSLLQALPRCGGLTHLSISGVRIDRPAGSMEDTDHVACLASVLERCKSLRQLSLRIAPTSTSGAEAFADAWAGMPELEDLTVSHWLAESVAAALPQMKRLKRIEICGTSYGDGDEHQGRAVARRLAKAVAQMDVVTLEEAYVRGFERCLKTLGIPRNVLPALPWRELDGNAGIFSYLRRRQQTRKEILTAFIGASRGRFELKTLDDEREADGASTRRLRTTLHYMLGTVPEVWALILEYWKGGHVGLEMRHFYAGSPTAHVPAALTEH
uniref:Uncharacterized protein n=1 Tax=Phaeomonas parva TaxID=124430 RepID=A0A7S1UEX4_9STRA|mmetsp:Transcript_44688/g.140135  ORF Transcript_44688/g.140135 Transcript_44688/m.140135 type:complete len:424 (+) Transcript_44688:240-1511(+)